jgi:phosphatidylglycerophosphatase A
MKKFILNLATLFGCGKSPIFPGTIGAFLGVLFYAALIQNLGNLATIIATIFLLPVAVIVCEVAEKEIGEKDPSCVIFDEFAAMPLCFFGMRQLVPDEIPQWVMLSLGFAVFRFFDIVKPLGIKNLQKFAGGFGIVVDDVVAAIYTNIAVTSIFMVL